MPSREKILTSIKEIAAGNSGVPPGAGQFHRKTGFRESDWRGVYWARWSDALVEAGFPPNEWQGRIDETILFEKLAEAVLHFGHFPTSAEMQLYRRTDKDFPYAKIARRYGGLPNLSQSLKDWSTATGQLDVAALIAPSQIKTPLPEAAATDGCVYLLESGGFYKIGRSDQLERRVKQIRVTLPQSTSLLHSIQTDDPSGIEAYWHRRFAAKRANGEWFKLSAADVKTFRRRKFQ